MSDQPPLPAPWRSIDEVNAEGLDAAIGAEFPALHEVSRVSRRELMRLMGASLALAGGAGCGGPAGKPLLSQPTDPENSLPGRPIFFATSLELDGYGRGALVETHDGRPIKIEGNALHPASLGATDPFIQAEVLSLYDPDRSRQPWRDGRPVEWSSLRRWLAEQRLALAATRGAGTHILIGATSSPTVAGLIARIRALYPGIQIHSYSPISNLIGDGPEPVYDFGAVDAVLSLGADFLGPGPAQVPHARAWTGRRRLTDAPRPLLFLAEPSPTLTGAQADLRLPLTPHRMEVFAASVAAELGIVPGPTPAAPEVAQVAAALVARRGLVVAGDEASPLTRSLVFQINQRLGMNGVRFVPPVRLGAAEGLLPAQTLLAEMAAGRVQRLLVLDANPAYDLPGFDALAALVPECAHLGLHRDETARACRWHIPKRHPLEAWGDLRAFEGTVGLQQPATRPLLPAVSALELLGMIAGERPDGQALVRGQWAGLGEAEWLSALEMGIVPGTGAAPIAPAPPAPVAASIGAAAAPFSLTFQPDARMWDGRYANNGWLQELPHPLTKLVWGNAALIAPATAELLGVENGDLLDIARGLASVQAPAWIMPGQAPGAITLSLGYGRPFAGRVGDEIGVNAYPLRAASGALRVRKAAGKGRVISTQQHQPLGMTKALPVAEAAPTSAVDDGFYPEFVAVEHAWGMVIDIDACIGCGACTIACQAENNIPVVGPEEVEMGREMHWIRVDRYHDGPVEAPDTFFQPVPCMHCEKAPCEVVCPVGATSHSSEGLNQMVYNRCIGTRTCSNNCPYKVRRFNWYDYHDRGPPTPAPVHNPRVTVRDRGVMEKCTYCVQRINTARAQATVEGREIRESEVVTACQSACPTNAIVFGDLADPNSAVSRLKRSPRNFAMLGGLNTQPRTTYLARVRRGPDG